MTTPLNFDQIFDNNQIDEYLVGRLPLPFDLVNSQGQLILVGIVSTATTVTLNFNLTPILSGGSSLISNWSITGPTVVTISAVTVVGNGIRLTFSGTNPGDVYTISVPVGIQANDGSFALLDYLGPFTLQFGGGAIPIINPTILGAVASANLITVTFSENMTQSGPSSLNPINYSITGPTAVSVTGVSIAGNQLILNTTEQRTAGAYSIIVPGGFISVATGNPLGGILSVNFTGVGTSPIAVRAEVIDSNRIRVIYSEVVQPAGALIPANYSIDNGLIVVSIEQETGSTFLLRTSPQSPGVLYTITVSNVLDLQGNLI